MVKRITSSLLFILALVTFLLVLLLKIVDFYIKKICTVCNEIGDFIGFSKLTGSLLNIQNGGLHWSITSHMFDNFLILHPILIGFAAEAEFNKGLCS